MNRFSLTAVAALVVVANAAMAQDYKIADLVITDPMAFETVTTAQTAGGFVTITNNGATADRLVAVEAAFPRVEIHTTQMDDDIARMIHLEEGVVIPAGETVTLQPGGMHVMFMGLGGDPFETGETVPATLVFENAGALDIAFTVQARKMDAHSGMDHSDHN